MPYVKMSAEKMGDKDGYVCYPIILENVDAIYSHECWGRHCKYCPLKPLEDVLKMDCARIRIECPGLVLALFGYDEIKETGYYADLLQKGVIDPEWSVLINGQEGAMSNGSGNS